MKIELIEEKEWGKNDWYYIVADGKFVDGSFNQNHIEDLYHKILEDPSYFTGKVKNVLKSDEIVVPLGDSN